MIDGHVIRFENTNYFCFRVTELTKNWGAQQLFGVHFTSSKRLAGARFHLGTSCPLSLRSSSPPQLLRPSKRKFVAPYAIVNGWVSSKFWNWDPLTIFGSVEKRKVLPSAEGKDTIAGAEFDYLPICNGLVISHSLYTCPGLTDGIDPLHVGRTSERWMGAAISNGSSWNLFRLKKCPI